MINELEKQKYLMSDALRSLLAFVTLTIVIPVLLTLGNGPTFFVAHGLNSFNTFFIVLFIIIIPLIFFSAPILCVALFGLWNKFGLVTAGILNGSLTALLVVKNLPDDLNIVLSLVLASSAGILCAFYYVKSYQVKRVSKELGPIILIITAIWFFFISPASGLFKFGVGKNDFISSIDNPVPVTIVVFDEFHIAALLDRKGSIDDVRFPNFARLAKDAVWFPNAIANYSTTKLSIPTILTGNYIEDVNLPPNTINYPRNILNSFSSIYSISALEQITRLCPEHACSSQASNELPKIFSDIRLITLKSILPNFITSELPTLDGKWAGFGIKESSKKTTNLDSFLSLIEKEQKAQLNFIHLLTPHIPYNSLSDGRKYISESTFPPGFIKGSAWIDNDILIETAYHRYLHQVGYTDFLLGKILNKLQETDNYDESIIVVTADHGVAFVNGNSRRSVGKNANFKEIYKVPFFIKLPSSKKLAYPGTVNPTLVSHLDIVPTIAKLLGTELPFDMQGDSIFDLAENSLRKIKINKKPVSSAAHIQGFDRLPWQIERFGDRTPFSVMTRIDGLHGDLIGKSISAFAVDAPTESIKASLATGPIGPLALPNAFTSFLPVRVQGTMNDSDNYNSQTVVLALNGKIGAITQTTTWNGVNGYFEAMLPPDYFSTHGNQLSLFLTNIDSQGVVSLIPVFIPEDNNFAKISFVRHKNGSSSEIITKNYYQYVIEKAHGGIYVLKNNDNIITLNGWSASSNFNAPEAIVAFSGDKFLNSSIIFDKLINVDRHLIKRGATPCKRCRYGFAITLYTEQFAEIGDELRVFALYSDATASEIESEKINLFNSSLKSNQHSR